MQAELTNWVDQSLDSVHRDACSNPDGSASEASQARHHVWFHPEFLTNGILKAWVVMLVGMVTLSFGYGWEKWGCFVRWEWDCWYGSSSTVRGDDFFQAIYSSLCSQIWQFDILASLAHLSLNHSTTMAAITCSGPRGSMVMRLDGNWEEWGYIVRWEYGTVWVRLNYFKLYMLLELIIWYSPTLLSHSLHRIL